MYKVLRFANKTVDAIVFVAAILMLLYSFWSFSDITGVYSDADSRQIMISDTGEELSYEDLQRINKDVCGKLIVYDTGINYPVVQGKTNGEYLNKDIYGAYRVSGSIFIDFTNARDFSDRYMLVYGHRMKSSVMFSDIGEFLDGEYFDKHTMGYIETDNASYDIHFFACMKTTTKDIVLDASAANSQYDKLFEHIMTDSQQVRPDNVSDNPHIIALSTCENAESNGRIILFGELVKI